MSQAARLTDTGSAHGCFPPTPVTSGSPNVSINGLPAARKGDSVLLHACPCPYMPHGIHGRAISAGSSSVSVNGKPAARLGDAIDCGGSISTGSSNVFIGDTPWRSPAQDCIARAAKEGVPLLRLSPMPDSPPPPVIIPVFAKSCLREAGCTDAGTEEEPYTNFGDMKAGIRYFSATDEAITLMPVTRAGTSVVTAGAATGAVATGAAIGEAGVSTGTAASLENLATKLASSFRGGFILFAIFYSGGLNEGEHDFLKDPDFLNRIVLLRKAKDKRTATTRVRYLWQENPQTGELKAVGYHTSAYSGRDQVKVRLLEKASDGKYLFTEDDGKEPVIFWTPDNPGYKIPDNTSGEAVSSPLPVIPGLEIPDIRGVTVLPGPVPEEKDFRDYILVFPQNEYPPVYIYLSKPPVRLRPPGLAGEAVNGEEKSYLRKRFRELMKEQTVVEEEGRGESKIGDFTNLEGSTVGDILDRIPDKATLRELHPVSGGATEGFEFKWVQDGQTYRVRVHSADPGAPAGSNAANGWVVRIQRGKQYYDSTINDFRPAKYTNPNGDFFDESIMNNTHIPIKDPYEP